MSETIEIGKIKVEVSQEDVARKIDTYRVGDHVQVLHREYDTSPWKTSPGIVVAFHPFAECPAVQVAYIETSYSTAAVKFATITEGTLNIRLCGGVIDELALTKERTVELFNKRVEEKRLELERVENERAYFLKYFGHLFGGVATEEKEEDTTNE